MSPAQRADVKRLRDEGSTSKQSGCCLCVQDLSTDDMIGHIGLRHRPYVAVKTPDGTG